MYTTVRHVRLPSGLAIEFAEQGQRGGPALLMLHGITDTWRSFEPVLPWLPPDWHVVSMTQRGHGGSRFEAAIASPILPGMGIGACAFARPRGVYRQPIEQFGARGEVGALATGDVFVPAGELAGLRHGVAVQPQHVAAGGGIDRMGIQGHGARRC